MSLTYTQEKTLKKNDEDQRSSEQMLKDFEELLEKNIFFIENVGEQFDE